MSRSDEGTWPELSLQRSFAEGAAWWQWRTAGSTMFPSERDEAETEAVRRYGSIVIKSDEDAQAAGKDAAVRAGVQPGG